jgi:serine/threonine-protein kinase
LSYTPAVKQAADALAAGMQVTPNVRLTSPLGAGGMGAVWLADHTALNTRVVVKFMLGGGLDSSTSARTRFKREAEAASQVKSPHVVQTFDYGVTADGVPFIVMEHLEGRDLAAEIAARGALDPVTVIAIVSQVAKALGKAHGAGVLHRDIKPDNIFLCQTDAEDELFVKLLDFGIAKTYVPEGEEGSDTASLDSQTKTGQVVGTPYYMSPEQVTAQKVIDLRSDLWALGVVAFEALTGKRPYDGPSFGALAVKIATGAAPKPSDVKPALPRAVDTWFAKACAREPAARFASARELADRLRDAFDGVVSLPPIVSSPADSGERAVSGERGPISVDDDANERPSFVLASTASSVPPPAKKDVLARSDGGAALAIGGRSGESAEPRGPSPRLKLIVPIVALGIVTVAIGVGWKGKERSVEPPSSSSLGATAKNAPPHPLASAPAVSASSAPAPVLMPASGASASAPSSVVPVASAAPIATRPPALPTSHVHPPIPPTPPSAKPAHDAGPAARPSASPHDDPLF